MLLFGRQLVHIYIKQHPMICVYLVKVFYKVFIFGFGRGCGTLFGGFLAAYFGTDITFRVYGIICLIFMGLFIYLNHRYQRQTVNSYGQYLNIDDSHHFMDNSPILAPHGSPANPKWQSKFSSGKHLIIPYLKFFSFLTGLTASVKPDQLPSTPIPPV